MAVLASQSARRPNSGSSSGAPTAAGSPTAQPVLGVGGYLVTVDELRRRGKLAAEGEEPYKSAVNDLLEWADAGLDDVSQPTQPLLILGTDNPFVDDARRAYGLGLAYVISE
ncbi:MAG: hypothetical protein M3P84_13220, partial [Chloroflexota bacterium]|nr:hypothetical protein [Chloroflexota bacterium]